METKVGAVGAQVGAVETKVVEEISRNQATLLKSQAGINATLKQSNADVLKRMDNMDQSNVEMKQSNAEMKAAIASLTGMVTSLLKTSSAGSIQFPTCEGSATHSFATYMKGRVAGDVAIRVAAATVADCASKCLEEAACAAFSFAPNDCRLTNGRLSSHQLEYNRRSKYYNRLTTCAD